MAIYPVEIEVSYDGPYTASMQLRLRGSPEEIQALAQALYETVYRPPEHPNCRCTTPGTAAPSKMAQLADVLRQLG